MLVCLLFSRRCFHLKESPVFKRVPEASNRPGVVAKTVAQTTFRFGYWKWVELIAIFSRPTFLRPLFAPRLLLLGHNCETSRVTVSTRRVLASWTIFPKEVLEPLLPQIDYTLRFARVAIFPKPNSRRSAVTSVRPSTSAVAAKKRSAGSGCSSGNSWAATTISCVNGASRMCIVAFATQSRIVPSKCIRRLACNSSASQVLTGDNHSSFWPSLSSCCTRRESRLG